MSSHCVTFPAFIAISLHLQTRTLGPRKDSNYLTTDETGKGGSNNGTFGRNLGEAASEKIDILEMVFVGFAENLN